MKSPTRHDWTVHSRRERDLTGIRAVCRRCKLIIHEDGHRPSGTCHPKIGQRVFVSTTEHTQVTSPALWTDKGFQSLEGKAVQVVDWHYG